MRFTFEPLGDVVVAEGTDLAACRGALASLGGETALLPLSAGGSPLGDDHVAGAPPWVAGSLVRAGSTVPDPVRPVLHAPWHLAVVDGHGVGTTAAPGRDGTVLVGRREAPARGTRRAEAPVPVGELGLPDPAVSRQHATVGRRRRHGGATGPWWVRDDASANGTVLVTSRRGRPRRTTVGRRPRRLRPGDLVLVGATAVELRRTALEPPAPVTRAAQDGPTGRLRALVVAARDPAVLVPLAGGLVMASLLRSPVLLAMALVAPVTALLVRADRHRRPDSAHARPPRGDDAALGHPGPSSADGPAGSARRGPGSLRSAADGALVLADPASAACRAAADHGGTVADAAGTGPPGWRGLAVDGALGLVGPRDRALAVARSLVAEVLADASAELTLLTTERSAWAWLRWAGVRLSDDRGARVAGTAVRAAEVLGRSGSRTVVVVDGVRPWRTVLHRFWLRGTGAAVVVLVEDQRDLPAWCSWAVRLLPDGAASLAGPGWSDRVRAPGLDERTAEEHARRCAAPPRHAGSRGAQTGGDGTTASRLPSRVALADVAPPPDPGTPRRREAGTLAAPLGVGDAGPVVVDLLRDGPHALVAGTTGAGKSELLQTLVLGLASRYRTADLAVVLVDYKGGAGLGRAAALPHVVAQVTDLDGAASERALEGLRAELRRRERLLASVGAADVRDLPDERRPARLLVVVDEFRALAEDLPAFVPSLVRLAAQGRSLGIHLVLATQRPAGVVDAQLRANLPLRICLRVADDADSRDVVGVPDAATLPPDAAGRALVARPGAPPTLVQTAWAALPAGVATPHPVRAADPWDAWHPDRVPDRAPSAVDHGPAGDHVVDELVAAVTRAHRAEGDPVPEPPWLPPLPTDVRLPAQHGDAPTLGDALTLGVTDLPAERRRGALEWAARDHLAVVGGPGSGRSTTGLAVVHAALAHGRPVHVVHAGAEVWTALRDADHPALGTVVGVDEPATTAALLRMLRTVPARARTVLVVDDVAAVRSALERLPRGAGDDLVETLARDAAGRVAIVVAGAPRDLHRLLPVTAERLVLHVGDRHDAEAAGLPAHLWSPTRVPGRVVHVPSGVVGQVGRPPSPLPPSSTARAGDVRVLDRPPRLVPLPTDLALDGLPAAAVGVAAPTSTPLVLVDARGGHGAHGAHGARTAADDARARPQTALPLDVSRGLLVSGPAGSGRTTAVRTVADRLVRLGRTVVTEVGREPAVGTPALPSGAVVVLDDLDVLVRRDPSVDDRVLALLEDGVPVVASARADRVATAFRGALAALRNGAPLVALRPGHPSSADAAGEDLSAAVDPAAPTVPGRAALVDRGCVTAVQIAR